MSTLQELDKKYGTTKDDLWEANEKYRSKGRNLRIA
tara:strand:+ start:1357 stop:1464 length:108 start_codon:yes stop_codon:yes gene_type:complete